MTDASTKGFNENFAGAPASRAEGTAQYVQSFDEITITSQQPATASPWVPRGVPAKGHSEDPKSSERAAADGATPHLLGIYDDATNLRADNVILVRATPTSSKAGQDKRPNKLRTYQDASGEGL